MGRFSVGEILQLGKDCSQLSQRSLQSHRLIRSGLHPPRPEQPKTQIGCQRDLPPRRKTCQQIGGKQRGIQHDQRAEQEKPTTGCPRDVAGLQPLCQLVRLPGPPGAGSLHGVQRHPVTKQVQGDQFPHYLLALQRKRQIGYGHRQPGFQALAAFERHSGVAQVVERALAGKVEIHFERMPRIWRLVKGGRDLVPGESGPGQVRCLDLQPQAMPPDAAFDPAMGRHSDAKDQQPNRCTEGRDPNLSGEGGNAHDQHPCPEDGEPDPGIADASEIQTLQPGLETGNLILQGTQPSFLHHRHLQFDWRILGGSSKRAWAHRPAA